MKDKIEMLGYCIHTINQRNKEIEILKKENEQQTKLLKKIANDEEIRRLIINHLHIEDNGEPRILGREFSYTTSDGAVNNVREYYNPNASFNPELDNFDIVDVEFDYTLKMMRIKVDCIRRHKHINAFMCEPDYYWTDYIDISEFGEINR